jgi:hypothetical protein
MAFAEVSSNAVKVKKFLEYKNTPIPMGEFKEFWESLTLEEKTKFSNEVTSIIYR